MPDYPKAAVENAATRFSCFQYASVASRFASG
jgi:hypothetical protein